MKIAFVGKGGSGKSTLSALFTSYTMQSNKGPILLIDADTNMHSGTYFGVTYNEEKLLSKKENTQAIKEGLIKDNKRIASANHMVKTTPPGSGSHSITRVDDPLLARYDNAQDPLLTLLAVGGYGSTHAGTACYHTSLAIVENILSHMDLQDQYCIVDMVASTDAFSNSFHIQFDVIVLIVEPTRESTTLVKEYLDLAKKTNVQEKIIIIGNKIEGEDDVEYIQEQIGQHILSYLPYDRTLKKYMREEDTIHAYVKDHQETLAQLFAHIHAKKPLPRHEQLCKLAELHKKYAQQSYITNELGDLSGQIDASFIQGTSGSNESHS